ncbi:MAG: GAF domain-containing sensor histidine kinase [Thermodesulfobacteria bacterium]|nr:GAF domain-containing sensor histidine kinase [Thermodesulfobacteriota bacterium]
MLDFVVRLNTAFATANGLEEIFSAILAGVTAGEGLGFNRAFLFLVDEKRGVLQGRFGLGPCDFEEAGRIWSHLSAKNLSLFELLEGVKDKITDDSQPLNRFVRAISIPLSQEDNCLVQVLQRNKALLIADSPRVGAVHSHDLCCLFGTGELAAAPLSTQGKSYGVVVADNIFTRAPILEDSLYTLHLFAGLASLAIRQMEMCNSLEDKIFKLKEANKAVEAQKNLLIEIEKYSAIGRMLDHLLHEIRNPLSAIGGIARLLLRREDDDAKRQYLATVVKEVEKIEDTLRGISELHDIKTISCFELELKSLVDATLIAIQADFDDAGIVVHKNYPRESVWIMGDREKLQEAILCVLKNSIEAMPDGGIIVVALTRKGADIELRISDSGLGIARGHFKKADNPFFTTKLNAMGLGLSKAKKILELHGGTLLLTSNRIGGTTCIITLPRILNP